MNRRELLKFGWLFVEKIFITIFLFLSSIYVIQKLGVQDFGKLAYFQLVLGLIIIVYDFGFRRVYVSIKNSRLRKLYFDYIIRKKYQYLIPFQIVCTCVIFKDFSYNEIAIILVSLVFIPLNTYSYECQSRLKIKQVSILNIVLSCVFTILKIACVEFMNEPLFYIMLIVALNNIALYIGCWLLIKRDKSAFVHSINKNTFGKFIKINNKRSMYLFASIIALQLFIRSDQLVINHVLGTVYLAVYVAAFRFIEQIVSLLSMANSYLLPMLIKESRKDYEKQLISLYTITYICSIPISSLLFFASEPLVHYLLGSEFIDSARLLKVLAVALPFMFMSNIGGTFYSMYKIEAFAMYRNIISLISMLFLSCLMGLIYGVFGVAISLLVVYVCNVFVFELINVKTRKNVKLKITALRNIFVKGERNDLLWKK